MVSWTRGGYHHPLMTELAPTSRWTLRRVLLCLALMLAFAGAIVVAADGDLYSLIFGGLGAVGLAALLVTTVLQEPYRIQPSSWHS